MGARLAPTGLRCPGKCRQPSDVGAAGDHSLEEAGARAPRSISCLLVYCRWLHQAASFTRTDLSSFLVLRPRPGSREDSVHDVRCCWSTDGRHAHLRTVAGSAAVHRRRAHGSLDVQRKRLRESVRRRGNALRNETHNGQVAVSASRPVLLRHPGTPPPCPQKFCPGPFRVQWPHVVLCFSPRVIKASPVRLQDLQVHGASQASHSLPGFVGILNSNLCP